MITREELEDTELKILAPYAEKSANSRGRKYKRPEHPFRTVFQRDRDRIVHCRAFRGLEYKPQLFESHEGDHFRTRLTHTMEVASIGRTIARTLRLNEDLTEAICLVHDVGHPPFGHSGEAILNELMAEHGGFEHNLQSLRVVDVLERKYPDFPGLNLTWEVREGIMKHSTEYDKSSADDPALEDNPSLEAQIVCIADEIAYNSHDIDDGLDAGILADEQMEEVDLWKQANEAFFREYPNSDKEIKIYYGVRNLINFLVGDLTEYSLRLIKKTGVESPDDVRKYKTPLIVFSAETAKKETRLKKFLLDNVYHHPHVERRNEIARKIIQTLFHAFIEDPKLISDNARVRLKKENKYRVVCDYIAGMTDRYAKKKHDEIFGLTDADLI
jgi:dGTPase